jgi:hypothetical protein
MRRISGNTTPSHAFPRAGCGSQKGLARFHWGARGGQASRRNLQCNGSHFTHAPLLHTTTVQTVDCARTIAQATESLAIWKPNAAERLTSTTRAIAPQESGISKSQVSKLCKDIDEQVHAFLDRPQREGGRIVSVAAIIAVAVNT